MRKVSVLSRESFPISHYGALKMIPHGSVNVGKYVVDRYKVESATRLDLRGDWTLLEGQSISPYECLEWKATFRSDMGTVERFPLKFLAIVLIVW